MSSFTPTSPVNLANERDWAANLGMLDWDATSIVFTKRSLMEFLKYTGTTVDTNFANIQKLPRYAKFGKIADSDFGSPAASTAASDSAAASPAADFKPTRRVREPPGGSRTDIFAVEDVLDALSLAPPKPEGVVKANVTSASSAVEAPAPTEAPAEEEEVKTQGNAPSGTGIKPSRRVREAPGGNSSLGRIWGSDEPEEFKPTRRVRQAPGGGTSSGIF
ncbi:hypothetical protein B0H17DRAFT_470384 [Mycena rosella]|uniref:Uncharacterized protein n=1 Tax=Mycena rosella TaxID=1033263 RepID=A0AAD7DLE3_MYCRO|nr:hypothetical protein B0H17DRAFT_470384 [Mycena rosella]